MRKFVGNNPYLCRKYDDIIKSELAMTNPLITIVVPIYKVEKYLGRCIDSLVAQTYPNIEIILADDGSPDRCGAICDEYAQKDSRIKVIHQENKGVAAARNAALDIAQGEYIMFVDSDDYVEPTFCEIPLKTAQQQNADMVIFGYRRFINGKFANIKVAGFTRAMTSAETIRHFVLYDVPSIYNMVTNKMFHRSLFESIRFPEGFFFEDNEVSYRTAHIASRIYVIEDVLYDYAIRNDSITGVLNKSATKQLMDRFKMRYGRLCFIKEHYPQLTDLQICALAKDAVAAYMRINGNTEKERAMRKELSEFLMTNKKTVLAGECHKKVRFFYKYRRLAFLYRLFHQAKQKYISYMKK